MANSTKEFFDQLQDYRLQNKVVDFYDKYASEYDNALIEEGYLKICEYGANTLKDLFDMESKPVDDNAVVLDIGCGSGLTGQTLKNASFKNVDGADASEGMLRVAGQKNIYRKLSQGKVTKTERFDLLESTYDGVFCIGCIGKDHIEIKDVLPEMLRLLKKGGIAVYTISPSLDKIEALKEHFEYFEKKLFEILKIERKYYVDQMFGQGDYCHLYSLKKL